MEMLTAVQQIPKSTVGYRMRPERRSKQYVDKMQKSMKTVEQMVALANESSIAYMANHQTRVARLAGRIAREMRLSKRRVDNIHLAASVHDMGMALTPRWVLSKKEPLTESEFNMIMAHAYAGYDILQELSFPYPVATIILQHHERINGCGYPFNLSGKDILLESKILAVSDVVEAMSSPRPYRQNAGLEFALDEITQYMGILYDARVVYACKSVVEQGFCPEK